MTPEPTQRATREPDFGQRLASARPALRAHATALIGARGPIDPDDIVQEALSRAWIHRATFDQERPLLPWLKQVTLRALLDLRERGRREPELLEAEPEARSAPDPIAAREEVQRLLARLPRREAQVLDRFHRGSESIQAIARDLGLPQGTVKSLLHRARKRLAGEDS